MNLEMDPQAQTKLIQTQTDDNGRPLNPQKVSSFRRYLPQVFATMAKNLTVTNTGLYDSFPSIIIPSLIGISRDLNPNETVHATPSQASWIASFASVVHPFAAVIGWLLSDAIGRKKSLMLAAIPPIIAWTMLGFANSLTVINIAFMLMGLGLGLKEAASLTYTGEVTETSIRGILLSSAGIFNNIGQFGIFFIGAFLPWRTTALICVTVPLCVFTAAIFIPETPIWLLSKGRHEKALKSLQWLRGWVSPDTVHDEYQSLKKYSIRSRACKECAKKSIECDHKRGIRDKVKQLKHIRILKPLILVIALQFFLQFSPINTWRPYIIQIFNAYTVQWDASFATIVLSSLGFAARICVLPMIKVLGKRKLYLMSTAATFLSCFGLCAIGFYSFPSGWSSFQVASKNETIGMNSTTVHESVGNYSYLALVLILVMQFASNVGVANVAFMLIGEVFPFQFRAMLVSIVSGVRYLFGAISTKMYYNIEMWLSLPGAAAFYGCVSLVGFIVMFLILPETEGRSLEEIELHFSDNSRSMRDTKIQRKTAMNDVS